MHFQSLQLLKITFKLEQKKYLETEDQPVRKVIYLRTRNPTIFSLYFSDFSTSYYDFPNLQLKFQKGPARHYSSESQTS